MVTKNISVTWQEGWSVMHKYSYDCMPYTNNTQYHQGEKYILVLKDKSEIHFTIYFFSNIFSKFNQAYNSIFQGVILGLIFLLKLENFQMNKFIIFI